VTRLTASRYVDVRDIVGRKAEPIRTVWWRRHAISQGEGL